MYGIIFTMTSVSVVSMMSVMTGVSGNGYIVLSTSSTDNWVNSRDACLSTYGTHLATITNDDENGQVFDVIAEAGITSHTWIGVADRDELTTGEGIFVYSDETPFGIYENWVSGQPDNFFNEDCAEMYVDTGLWNDEHCITNNLAVCNYPQYRGIDDVLLSFNDADNYCMSKYGSNLATLTSYDAWNETVTVALLAQLFENNTDTVWIGVYSSNETDDTWQFTDGKAIVYENWEATQNTTINGNGGDYCIGINSIGEFVIADSCDDEKYFVCNFYGSLSPTHDPTNMPSVLPTAFPTHYECDLDEDDLIVSWDSVFSDSSYNLFNETSISLTQGSNNVTGVFEVDVTVTSKYLVGATYSAYSNMYESVTTDGFLGVTYVLDTNEFESEGRLLQDSNTCENRVSSSYDNETFLTSFWEYTLFPSDYSLLGSDDYLEYGDQNVWTLTMSENNVNYEECDQIEWQNTFSFYDLWHECKDSNSDPSYELVTDDDTISLNINFYLTLVSPNPLYLTQCNGGSDDCGQYITKTLISHPLSVVFSKTQSIISNKDNVVIDLFTSHIAGAVFIEGTSTDNAQFILTLETSVPAYMALDIDTSILLSPSASDLRLNNDNVSFIGDYYVTEATSSYFTQDCLILTDYRCWQRFEIIIELDECPSDTGLVFDGDYFFTSDFKCNVNSSDECDDFLSDEPLAITLDSVDLDFTELCDETVYEVDWSGDLVLYSDDTFTTSQLVGELVFELGDTVYASVSVENDISGYEIFGMEIVQCYVCTSDIPENDTSQNLESCIDPSVDTSLFYTMPDDSGLSFTLIDSNTTADQVENFSFVLPALADDTFYIDCTVELTINNVINSRRSRRMLLQTGGGNVFETVVGSGSVSSGNDDNSDDASDNGSSNNNDSDDLFSSSVFLIVVGATIGVLLIVIVLLVVMYQKQFKFQRNRDIGNTLKLQESTTNASEAGNDERIRSNSVSKTATSMVATDTKITVNTKNFHD